ncbi:DNA-deoxyinosine glycosylase [Flavobacterium crassostreae]|uniref:DNA-deoxyinosine glycosylase n=1 Tax=Flavobacterium crassostreae TaxID=1763534 RepID=A0A1B9E9F5_9FLAO|nr:DNA-deoxyinosine glycosylase [Flavobacterium crassostreae]OCB78579.1 DNA-deoxyinosine glycosylase [Flavobacterium crassostreae]
MVHSFAPYINATTRIVILGTMPGVVSLEKQEYYAHKRNHFLPIMYQLFSKEAVSEVFEEKIALLQRHSIGLWDVLKQCDRKGSLDADIKNPQENDFDSLFQKYPQITTLIFNGKESHKLFFKKFGQIEGITYYVMPSTSAANTLSFDKKRTLWASCF